MLLVLSSTNRIYLPKAMVSCPSLSVSSLAADSSTKKETKNRKMKILKNILIIIDKSTRFNVFKRYHSV